MNSSNKFKEVSSSFHFNIEQIVPHLSRDEKDLKIVVDRKSDDYFHFLSYTVATSKF